VTEKNRFAKTLILMTSLFIGADSALKEETAECSKFKADHSEEAKKLYDGAKENEQITIDKIDRFNVLAKEYNQSCFMSAAGMNPACTQFLDSHGAEYQQLKNEDTYGTIMRTANQLRGLHQEHDWLCPQETKDAKWFKP
jgi:hypothetical protein